MDKVFKEILDKSSQAIKALEAKVEEHSSELAEDATELWGDIKKNFSGVDEKLKSASKNLEQQTDEANLQAHLGAMEAHDKVDGIKDTIDEFANKISAKAQTELDTAALRAHLAKKEAEDFWERKGKQITKDFDDSGDKVKKLALEATSEIKDYFEKLAKVFSKMS